MAFNEADHPRAPSGSPEGGEFAGAQKQNAKARPAGGAQKQNAKPAHQQHQHHGVMAYDPHADRGTGYGQPHGDPRVHQLQQALNRLGLTDMHGKVLADDGKLGPKTTAAVKKAQQRLGLPADGRVTAVLLDRLTHLKSLPARSAPMTAPTVGRAQMTSAEINDLPDSAFAYIEAGGSKDDGGKTTPRDLRHFPIHDEAHVRNALSRAPQSPFGDKAMPKIRAAAKKFGIEVSDTSRSREYYDRSFPLEGIEILSRAKGGDGRTVEAYAAVFDIPQEINDQHGHYRERIALPAFNKTLADGALSRAMCLYNHGMSVVDGRPDSLAQVPLGLPLEIRADRRGLLTVTRYNKTVLADAVLESIRNDDIRAQSFRGAIYRSDPMRVPRVRPGEQLPLVTRLELGLSDYGPTPRPYYDAPIVAVRSAQEILSALAGLDEDERAELTRMLATTRRGEPGPTATAYRAAGPEEPRDEDAHSGRIKSLRLRAEALFHGV